MTMYLLFLICFAFFYATLKSLIRGLHQVYNDNIKGILSVSSVGMLGMAMGMVFLASQHFFEDWDFMPPKIFLAVGLPILLGLVIVLTPLSEPVLKGFKIHWPIYLQALRILLALIFWQLYQNGDLNAQMTFKGLNFDILIGITALPVAYLLQKKHPLSKKIAIVWNILGLLMLLWLVIFSCLAFPSPFQYFFEEPSNRIMAQSPYILVPGFIIPYLFFLHFVSLKQLTAKKS